MLLVSQPKTHSLSPEEFKALTPTREKLSNKPVLPAAMNPRAGTLCSINASSLAPVFEDLQNFYVVTNPTDKASHTKSSHA